MTPWLWPVPREQKLENMDSVFESGENRGNSLPLGHFDLEGIVRIPQPQIDHDQHSWRHLNLGGREFQAPLLNPFSIATWTLSVMATV